MLDQEACWRAVVARDARFDGRFFTGVLSTGIYCRPVCPARTPNRGNVVFHPTAAAAQEAGLRACLRCRPETAPEMGAWRGTSNTVSRALALIEAGALDTGDAAEAGRHRHLGHRQVTVVDQLFGQQHPPRLGHADRGRAQMLAEQAAQMPLAHAQPRRQRIGVPGIQRPCFDPCGPV